MRERNHFARRGVFIAMALCLVNFAWGLPEPNPNPAFPTLNGPVTAMARIGATFYLGGEFSQVGGQARAGLAALDTQTGRVLAWNPNLPPSGRAPRVRSMTASATTVYVTDEFAEIGGLKRVMLAAVDGASGQVLPFDARYANELVRPATQGPVYALAWSALGLLVAGDFNAIGGQTRYGFAVLDPQSGDALAWNRVSGAEVRTLYVQRNVAYVGGLLVVNNAQGQVVRHNLAAIDLGPADGGQLVWLYRF